MRSIRCWASWTGRRNEGVNAMLRMGRRVLCVLIVIVLLGVLCALGLMGFVYY